MTEEIRVIIEKNLPAQVGDVLKEALEQAESDSKTVISHAAKIKELVGLITEKDALIKEYQVLDIRNKALDDRELELKGKEIRMEVEMLTYKLEAEASKTEFAKNVALGLVRNTEYRKTVFNNQTDNSNRDQFGNPIYINKTQNSNETKVNT